MNDEILVELDLNGLFKITTSPHHDAMAKIAGKNSFNENDLEAFKKLGYAVCNNTLDCHGRKVYIHHNMRTFKEKKQ